MLQSAAAPARNSNIASSPIPSRRANFDQIAQAVLRLQANQALSWNPHWGDLIQKAESGDSDHRLSAAFWNRYISQALSITADVRPRIRVGDPIPIRLTCRLRAGSDFTSLGGISLEPSVRIKLETFEGLIERPARRNDPCLRG